MKIMCETTENVIKHLQKNNVQCFIVGGFVRDCLLHIESNDIDIELHNTTLDNAYRLITEITNANIFSKFGIISLLNVNTEFSIARFEKKSGLFHCEFDITFIENGDLKLAASRRDFTINSIMYDLQTNVLVDNFNGVHDLENKKLKHVSSKFIEDPLRVLRGVRFSAKYNLTFDQKTFELCQKLSNELIYLPKSRIEKELKLIFVQKYFKNNGSLLTIFLNEVFKQKVTHQQFSDNYYQNIILFFKQFPNFEQVIDFCFEKKMTKRNIKFTINNYQDIMNIKEISSEEKYNVFEKCEQALEYIEAINNHFYEEYKKYEKLKTTYNGNEIMKMGYERTQIKEVQKRFIKEHL